MTGFGGVPLYYETNPISETERHINKLQAIGPDRKRWAAPGSGGMEKGEVTPAPRRL